MALDRMSYVHFRHLVRKKFRQNVVRIKLANRKRGCAGALTNTAITLKRKRGMTLLISHDAADCPATALSFFVTLL